MNGALNVHPKVVGTSVSGSLGVLVVWLLGLAHVTVDPVVAAAMVGVLASLGGWLAPIVEAEREKLLGGSVAKGSSPPGS